MIPENKDTINIYSLLFRLHVCCCECIFSPFFGNSFRDLPIWVNRTRTRKITSYDNLIYHMTEVIT